MTTKSRKKRKRKKEKDIFQALIKKFFVICQEEMWEQQNLDRHKPNNKRNYAAVIKTDREVSKLYELKDEVCPNDRDQLYDLNLETCLAQTLSAKQKWVIRWKPRIKASQKRAQQDSLIDTKPLTQRFTMN